MDGSSAWGIYGSEDFEKSLNLKAMKVTKKGDLLEGLGVLGQNSECIPVCATYDVKHNSLQHVKRMYVREGIMNLHSFLCYRRRRNDVPQHGRGDADC